MRILYTVLYLHLLPFILIRLLWRSVKAPGYRQRIHERFGLVPARAGNEPLLWVHAVSVGETLAAVPVIRKMMLEDPGLAFCITTTTPTGSACVKQAFGQTVLHYYLPYDVPSFFLRFIRKLRPNKLMIMETELWPNMLAVCEAQGVPVILANARMSEKSCKGYQRLPGLTRPMLEKLNIAAQSESDAARFRLLGADISRMQVTGSVKYDVQLTPDIEARVSALKTQLQPDGRKIILFASTHPKEDELILPVIKRLLMRDTQVLGFVVPRHPERFNVVARLAERHDLQCLRITDGEAVTDSTQLLLGDTMGDLLAFYGLASVAFVGGSLIDHGGHNILEPALWSLPVITGPSVYNFESIANKLVQAGGLVKVRDDVELERLLVQWLANPEMPSGIGGAGHQVLVENQGALGKLTDFVQHCE